MKTTIRLLLALTFFATTALVNPRLYAVETSQTPDLMPDPRDRKIELQKKLIAELKKDNARLRKENESLKSEVEKLRKEKQP